MIWGKSKNKMNTNLSPETEDEEQLFVKIDAIKQSGDVKNFLLDLKTEVEMIEGCKASFRIKRKESAIRKFIKNNHQRVEDIDDLCGLMIITDSLDKTYEVAQALKCKFQNPRTLDLNDKTGNYGVAPLSYVIYSNQYFCDIKESVPIEIRIQDKNRFLVIEALYYTFYKNDDFDCPEKWVLNEIMMQIMSRQIELDNSDPDESTKAKLQAEIDKILSENSALLGEYQVNIHEAWKEYARVIFEYNHNEQIEADSLFCANALEQTNDGLAILFDRYYKEETSEPTNHPAGARIEKAIGRIQNLSYEDFKAELHKIKCIDDKDVEK